MSEKKRNVETVELRRTIRNKGSLSFPEFQIIRNGNMKIYATGLENIPNVNLRLLRPSGG